MQNQKKEDYNLKTFDLFKKNIFGGNFMLNLSLNELKPFSLHNNFFN